MIKRLDLAQSDSNEGNHGLFSNPCHFSVTVLTSMTSLFQYTAQCVAKENPRQPFGCHRSHCYVVSSCVVQPLILIIRSYRMTTRVLYNIVTDTSRNVHFVFPF